MARQKHQEQKLVGRRPCLLYNSRVKGKPKKLHTKWMGPYVVEEIHTNGLVRLMMLQGIVFRKLVNGARLKC